MTGSKTEQITRLLRAYGRGDREALDRLLPLVYERLKQVARARLRQERPGHTLNTTGLVHEAYLKLVGGVDVDWQDRAHFLAISSRLMRQILIGAARRRKASKRGAGWWPVSYDDDLAISEEHSDALLDLDDVLERLATYHARAADVLQHHYFGGYSNQEIAAMLNVSLSTVERDLRFARAWLGREWAVTPDLDGGD
ncbi:MAG: ECF-type sigma factor [Rhodothermales bacterium]|nr:ECF-type sigma factor [Rhodothermales bacterium]